MKRERKMIPRNPLNDSMIGMGAFLYGMKLLEKANAKSKHRKGSAKRKPLRETNRKEYKRRKARR